jgi:hypothetical protein
MTFGIVLLVVGITVRAFWANNQLGGGIWTSVKLLSLIIAYWAGGTAMTIGGIYMLATDHPASQPVGKHGLLRIATEVRHV